MRTYLCTQFPGQLLTTISSDGPSRVRARQTLALLNLGVSAEDEPAPADPDVIITDLLRE